jgi:hypothetical protein
MILVRTLRQRDKCSYRKNVGLRSGLILVVKADRAIGAKIVGVSRFGRMPTLDSVHPPASDDLSLSIHH